MTTEIRSEESSYEHHKKRLFVDMDGVLAVFKPVDTMETLYEKGYFANLAPQKNVVDVIEYLDALESDIEVFVLSAYLSDSKYALTEKIAWLDKYLPGIDAEHRLFVPCGTDKKMAVPDGLSPDDFLLDDYTKNLLDWDPPGHGVKLLNGINHTRGTWKGDRIRHDQNLASKLRNLIMYGERVYDLPKKEQQHRTESR